MALYNNSAFDYPVMRISADQQPQYLFGSRNGDQQSWLFDVNGVALTSNVAAVQGLIRSGGGPNNNFVPTKACKIGIRGTASNSGIFNVDPILNASALLWVTSTGVIQVSFPLTHANVAPTVDVGSMVVQPTETADLVVQGSKSAPVALIFTPDSNANERAVFAEAVWVGTLPTTATVKLQVANVNDDARYLACVNSYGTTPSGQGNIQTDVLSQVTGSAVTQNGALYPSVLGKFIRAIVTNMTGGDGTTGLIVTIFA